jgi:hypothetical protein
VVVTGGADRSSEARLLYPRAAVDEPLLLHSLSEHSELIVAALEAVQPRRIVEIGSETGGFSKQLLDWAGAHGATLVTVEPSPTPEIRELAASVDHFELVAGRSPGALAGVEPADVYVIDGDHNHWTVTGELEAAYANGAAPLAILHDVGWPSGRRDQYYAPHAVPEDARQPYSYEHGVDPDDPGLVEVGGFVGVFQFAAAHSEGGERNGVLTAVEDFRARHPELDYRQVDAVFGVGYLFPAGAPYAARLRELLDPWHGSTLLARLERNRVRLFTRMLAAEDRLRRAGLRAGLGSLELEERIEAVEAENAALRLERARLREELSGRDAASAH